MGDLQITPADIQELMQESPLAREQLQRIAMARALAESTAELNALKSANGSKDKDQVPAKA